jgi:hypothetical protein
MLGRRQEELIFIELGWATAFRMAAGGAVWLQTPQLKCFLGSHNFPALPGILCLSGKAASAAMICGGERIRSVILAGSRRL